MSQKEELMQKCLMQILAKVDGTKNLLVDGKIIPAYNKLIGIQNKIANIIQEAKKQSQKHEQ